MERRYVDVNELSEYLGIPKGTLYVWACYKRIPHKKIGGSKLRFDLSEIDEWVKKSSVSEFNLN
jgi:excisionase family DNA binding protein